MKVIREQLIEAAIIYTDFNQIITYMPSMKRRFLSFLLSFFSVFFTVFWDCRSTKLLRLFSGNLPAMFLIAVKLSLKPFSETCFMQNVCLTVFKLLFWKFFCFLFSCDFCTLDLLRDLNCSYSEFNYLGCSTSESIAPPFFESHFSDVSGFLFNSRPRLLSQLL